MESIARCELYRGSNFIIDASGLSSFHYQQVIGDQGRQSVEKLRSLIVEGKNLPVLVGKELSVSWC